MCSMIAVENIPNWRAFLLGTLKCSAEGWGKSNMRQTQRNFCDVTPR